MNRYANLVGTNRISDEYSKINEGFDQVEQEMNAVTAGAENAQTAADAAQAAADAAQADANTAQSTANTAVTNAATAQSSANAAQTAADNAQTAADAAQAAADAAQEDANTANAGLTAHIADDTRHFTTVDRGKFAGIEEGAEVNQNAFAQVNDIEADDPSDTLTFAGGTGITVSTNPITKTVNITATGTSTPGAHAPSHLEDGSDPIPLATITNGGLMGAQDKQDLAAAKTAIAEGQTIPAPIVRGANVINATQASGATFKVLGCSLCNILGRDGGCESLTPFLTSGSGTDALSSVDGIKSIKFTTNNDAKIRYKDYSYTLDQSKYYLVGCWVYVDSYTSGSTYLALRDITTNTNRYTAPINTSLVGQRQFVYAKIPLSNTLVGGFRLYFGVISSGTMAVQFGSIRLYEVTAAEYAAIGTTITGEAIDRRWPYVDSVQHTQGLSVMMPGKNLLPPFTQWTRDSRANLIDPYTLELVATASGQFSTVTIPVVPGQIYTISAKMTGSAAKVGRVIQTESGTTVAAYTTVLQASGSSTITVPSGGARLVIYCNNESAGTFKYEELTLVLGDASNLPASFVPYNPQYAHAPIKLPSNVDRTIADSYDSATGQVFRRLITGMIIDGAFTWALPISGSVGYKRIGTAITPTPISDSQTVVKYNGQILVNRPDAGEWPAADMTRVTTNVGGSFYVTVSNFDSGWIDGIAPTTNAIKALMNGWRAAGNNGSVYNSWVSILSGAAPATNTEAYVAANKAPGWDAYATLDYVRATPITETLTGELGALSMVKGGNAVELLEGVVVREKANPQIIVASGYREINGTQSGTASYLSKRADRIIAVYKGADKDGKWTVATNLANGQSRAWIPPTDYDPAAEYYVDYIVLDKYAYTVNAVDATLVYQSTLGGAVTQATQDIARLKAQMGVHEWQLMLDEAYAANLRMDLDNLSASTTAAAVRNLNNIRALSQGGMI